MATSASPGTATSTCHGRRAKLQIELLASWTRVAFLLTAALLLVSSSAAGSSPSFGFAIHHRFSDTVRARFPAADLPERGTVRYFAAMVERDRIHGRRLTAGSTDSAPLTFVAGNTTYRFANLGLVSLVTTRTAPLSPASTPLISLPRFFSLTSWNYQFLQQSSMADLTIYQIFIKTEVATLSNLACLKALFLL